MELVNNTKKYWEFIRNLRNHDDVKTGFIQQENITQFHMDIAASIQIVTEEIMLKLATSIRKEYGLKNLCLAGGVALNCVANGKILQKKIFENRTNTENSMKIWGLKKIGFFRFFEPLKNRF